MAFLIRSHNVLFGLGKGFCENYNYNYNRNNGVTREFNDFPLIYPGIYNNLIASPSPPFYNLKEGYIPFNYNYGSFLNVHFNNFNSSPLQNLANDLNLQSLNINQLYNQNNRNQKQNMKK